MGAGPIRTCVACRARRAQSELVAVVRAPHGLWVAPATGVRTDRPPGRGAYVCPAASCVGLAFGSGALRRSLGRDLVVPGGLAEALLARLEREPA